MEGTMGGNKTRDGASLDAVVKALGGIEGVEIRGGGNHPYIARKDGYRPCPIATSTDVRQMVVKWVKEVTGYQNARDIYNGLREGYLRI
jgi:hypothetical protein